VRLRHAIRRSLATFRFELVNVRRPLKHDDEPQAIAIKRQRGGDTPNDEEWRDARNLGFTNVSALWPRRRARLGDSRTRSAICHKLAKAETCPSTYPSKSC